MIITHQYTFPDYNRTPIMVYKYYVSAKTTKMTMGDVSTARYD